MMQLNSDNQKIFNDFKVNRKIVEVEVDNDRATSEMAVVYFLMKDDGLTAKIDVDFAVQMVQNGLVAYINKETTIAKRKVAPYDITRKSRFVFFVPTPSGNQGDLGIVFENLKNFIDEN